MNRRHRRADAASDRNPMDRAEAIRLTCEHLANSTDRTVTGATLIMPDGSMTYLAADDARALHGEPKPGGRS